VFVKTVGHWAMYDYTSQSLTLNIGLSILFIITIWIHLPWPVSV